MAPSMADRKAALGRSELLRPGSKAGDFAARYIEANYGYNPQLAARRLRDLPATSEAVADAIRCQADMGVDEFILRPCAEELDQLNRLAEIAARFSEGE
jgi:hypothetical protein